MKKISNNFSIDLLFQKSSLLSNEELKLIIAGNSVVYGTYGVSLLDDDGCLIRFVSYGEMENNGGFLGSEFETASGYNPEFGSSAWGSSGSSSYLGGTGSSFNTGYGLNILNECSNSMLCYMEQNNIRIVSEQCDTHNYNSGNNTIYVDNDQSFNYLEMVHEFTHAFQENERMTGDRIYREFQAYLTGKIAAATKDHPVGDIFHDWVYDIVDQNGFVNMTKFYLGLSEQFSEFREHGNLYNYQEPTTSFESYNFRWEELFRTIGINMRV